MTRLHLKKIDYGYKAKRTPKQHVNKSEPLKLFLDVNNDVVCRPVSLRNRHVKRRFSSSGHCRKKATILRASSPRPRSECDKLKKAELESNVRKTILYILF